MSAKRKTGKKSPAKRKIPSVRSFNKQRSKVKKQNAKTLKKQLKQNRKVIKQRNQDTKTLKSALRTLGYKVK